MKGGKIARCLRIGHMAVGLCEQVFLFLGVFGVPSGLSDPLSVYTGAKMFRCVTLLLLRLLFLTENLSSCMHWKNTKIMKEMFINNRK